MIAAEIEMALAAEPGPRRVDPREGFVARAEAKAWLVREGDLDLHEGVDSLQAAAMRNGLIGALGQDEVQRIMGLAFAIAHKPAIGATVSIAMPEPSAKRAAASTVEALMFSLRERGAAALSEKATQRRLGELPTAQIQTVIERLVAMRARYPAIDDELLFLLGEQLP